MIVNNIYYILQWCVTGYFNFYNSLLIFQSENGFDEISINYLDNQITGFAVSFNTFPHYEHDCCVGSQRSNHPSFARMITFWRIIIVFQF